MTLFGRWWYGGAIASLALAGFLASESLGHAQSLRVNQQNPQNKSNPGSSSSGSSKSGNTGSIKNFPINPTIGIGNTVNGPIAKFYGRDPAVYNNPYTLPGANPALASNLAANPYVNPSVNPYVTPYVNPYVSPYVNPYTTPYVNPYTTPYANPYVNPYLQGSIYQNPYNPYLGSYQGVNPYLQQSTIWNPYSSGDPLSSYYQNYRPSVGNFSDPFGNWGGSVGPGLGYRGPGY